MKEKAVVAACYFPKTSDEQFHSSLEEVKALVKTADGEVAAVITQSREKPESSTYIGKGKVEELIAMTEETGADVVIFNDELSPGQLRNLGAVIDARVIDRTQLILDIFAGRARTKEGKIQVELAQLTYLLPRLAGQGTALSRLGGGIGTRGPGETKLETDRRHIQRRMDDLKKQLEEVKAHRESYRKQRKKNKAVQFALVGYTNAGKTTLLNQLTDADALAENLLFATLDPLSRQFELPSGYPAIITDTVGFIQDLPTTLVASFRSTLEEVKEADVILHVVDASHPEAPSQMNTVMKLLSELGAEAIPVLTVFNKIDQAEQLPLLSSDKPSIRISAFSKSDTEQLKEVMEQTLKEQMSFYSLEVPVEEGKALADIKRETILEKEKWNDKTNGFYLEGYAVTDHPIHGVLNKYKERKEEK
ncbi:GTPase HflX [Alteribacillus sp. HJP-4]|uniref:GTPase HflX n=1 Tax=Alteribacillus sp. HJP-4 TaxID=2775394 RepID=UPI0035CCCB27